MQFIRFILAYISMKASECKTNHIEESSHVNLRVHYESLPTFRRFASGLSSSSPSAALVLAALLATRSNFVSASSFDFDSAGFDEAGLAAAGFGFFFITTPFRGFLESFLAATVGVGFFTTDDDDVVGEILLAVDLEAESRGGEAAGAVIGGDFTMTLDAMALVFS